MSDTISTHPIRRRAVALTLGLAAAATVGIGAASNAAADVPDHHIITCESASFFKHFPAGGQPEDFAGYEVGNGRNSVGHSYDSSEGEQNGWVYSLDFDHGWGWGWILSSCLDPAVSG